MIMIHHTIIIGSGPAGLTAAIYAARANLSPLVITGQEPGGQLMTTTEVENYPGFDQGILGPELMDKMRKQAERFGAQFVDDLATAVDLKAEPKKVMVDAKVYQTKTVIIATGASAKWLGLESEKRLKGRGVSSCATCDGAFFKDKKVFVIGGGDSAMEEALFLTKYASSVTVLNRSKNFRASKIMLARATKHPKISFVLNTAVEEFIGEKKLEKIKTRNVATNEVKELPADGVFLAIGHKPNTELFAGQLEIDVKGYLKTGPEETRTGIPGVFVAGDIFDYRYRQAVTAAGSGCKAAINVEKYLQETE